MLAGTYANAVISNADDVSGDFYGYDDKGEQKDEKKAVAA